MIWDMFLPMSGTDLIRRIIRGMKGGTVVLSVLVTTLISAQNGHASSAKPDIQEPTAYRHNTYNSPVPQTLNGAFAIATEAAYALWASKRVGFIDVLPHTPKPANLPKDTFWRSAKRASIPRAVWLPNVGYGQIADSTAQYFKTGLFHITGGDRAFAIVFFCKRDCWMSWNAAKRAMEYGYETVFWYREGTDGWNKAALPTALAHPFKP